ncbi:MAG: tetratricopeptide repeat protein [Rhodocyclaceae bacterium]
MSLLMDALKKAEEAKRLAQTTTEGRSGGSGEFAETVGANHAAPESLPKLPTKLELLDDQFALPGANWRPESAPSAAEEAEKEAAAQLFAVKAEPSQKTFLIGLSAITLVAIAIIAGYFWWQLRPKSSLVVASAAPRNPAPPAAAAPATISPRPSAPSAKTPAPAPAVAAAAVGATPAQAPANAAQASPTLPQPTAAVPREPAPAVRPFRNRAHSGFPAADPQALETPAIRIGHGRLSVEPAVARGYRSFQAGDLTAARREYESALRSDPNNRDALHGLAAISLSQGQAEAAEAFYRRALEADPKDPTATAGLLNLRRETDPRQAEQRLSALAADRSEAHAAHFALGNLYAGRGQWRDAQQAYFQAYSGDPGNADYQFNLAVSLDHLRQARSALQYYQGALAAAATRPAAFAPSDAAARVRELQQELQQ